MAARAGIVVTGTEVLTGRVQDRNGPWLSDRLLEQGVELAHITICGDRPEDIEAQLRFMAAQELDLVITSGGLGPTADDMTVEIVARFAERELVLDQRLEQRIFEILQPLMQRFTHWDPEAMRAANRKQAMIPEGAEVIDPVGTAPGLVVPGSPVVVVLPGPPRELQPMWDVAVASETVQAAIASRTNYRQEMVRMFGLPESGLAETLREAERDVSGFEALEITTCLRRGEIEMVTRFEPERGGGLRAADGAGARPSTPARSSRRTVRAWTIRWPRCSRAGPSRRRSPAPPGWWPRDSPTGRAPRHTSPAAWWPTPTTRSSTCWAWTRR